MCPGILGYQHAEKLFTFGNNVLNHDFMLCSFHQLPCDRKDYSQQERLQWPAISYAHDIFLFFLNQFAFMIFFDVFNNTVNKGNIMILKIDYICFNSPFLFSLNNGICSITKWVFPVHLRSEFLKRKRYSIHIILGRLGLEQFLDVKTTCSYPAIGEIYVHINTGNRTAAILLAGC